MPALADGPEKPSDTLVLLSGDSAEIASYVADMPGRLEYAFDAYTIALPGEKMLLEQSSDRTRLGPPDRSHRGDQRCHPKSQPGIGTRSQQGAGKPRARFRRPGSAASHCIGSPDSLGRTRGNHNFVCLRIGR